MCNSSLEIVTQGHEDNGVSVLGKEQMRHKQCTTSNVGGKVYRESILIDHSKIMIRNFENNRKTCNI
jgi:hypothetical protein